MRTRNRIAATAAALLIAATACTGAHDDPAAAAGPAAEPRVVPALQNWTASGTPFDFTDAGRIVIDAKYSATLRDTAETFAQDISALGDRRPQVVTGAVGQTTPGDFWLSGDAPPGLGDEGYEMTVGATLSLRAPTSTGVFYGTRTVLQLLKQSRRIPGGVTLDRPEYPDRGLMLDTAAKFFPVPWLEDEIRDMAYLKLNLLHLHLADDQAFRLESDTHPEVVSPVHYSKADIATLVAFAAHYHVQIVPEIDMPGHMGTILAAHPDLALAGANSASTGVLADLSNPQAYTLMSDLIEEFLPLFPGKYFDVGADEYLADVADDSALLAYAQQNIGPNAVAADAYYAFANWADALVRKQGKTLRLWNDAVADDGTVRPNTDIIIEYWHNDPPQLDPARLADAGYQVMNASWVPTYYVLNPADPGNKPDPRFIYDTWTPLRFQGSPTAAPVTLSPAQAAAVRGADINVWCDVPDAETLGQIATGLDDPLRALAQKLWASPNPTPTYAAFHALAGVLGRAPGWSARDAGL